MKLFGIEQMKLDDQSFRFNLQMGGKSEESKITFPSGSRVTGLIENAEDRKGKNPILYSIYIYDIGYM
jgi:hypothetical protein